MSEPIVMTTKEIIFDHNNLPADISEVEWVGKNDYDTLATELAEVKTSCRQATEIAERRGEKLKQAKAEAKGLRDLLEGNGGLKGYAELQAERDELKICYDSNLEERLELKADLDTAVKERDRLAERVRELQHKLPIVAGTVAREALDIGEEKLAALRKQVEEYEKALEFVVERENFAFAECSVAEEIWGKCKEVLVKWGK